MRELPLILALALPAPGGDAPLAVRASTPELGDVVDWRLAPLDEHPGEDLLVVTRAGTLETFGLRSAEAVVRAAPGRLADPRHCALALAPLETGGRNGLFLATPLGVARIEPGADGGLGAGSVVLASRAQMRVRTGAPMFAPLAFDVNGDGRTDVVVPNGNTLEVWIQGPVPAEAGAARRFSKIATVQVRVSSNESTGADHLSDDLESSLQIPGLHLSDVNGDGRADLLVEDGAKRAFHLVRPDGSIPAVPDVAVDLSIFKDTTPRGEIELGRTLAGSDRAVYVSRDLNGDHIPDAVIAQGRKVWVFHGSSAGPQFTEPSNILKAADDVTAVMVLNLDDDDRPDLLLVKVQVPSLGTILRGLVSTWEVSVDAVGYRNGGERKFETAPSWKSTITFTVPSILSIAKDPDKLLSRFEDVGRKFRSPAEGDFDGDGARDVALVAEDAGTLDLWRGRAGGKVADDEAENDLALRRVLFEDPDRSWDLDRLIAWLSTFGEQRVALVTGDRAPDARLALRDRDAWHLASLSPGDVDGDGRDELVLCYEARDGSGRTAFDVVAWK